MWLDARLRLRRRFLGAVVFVVLLSLGCRSNVVDTKEGGAPKELVLDSGRVIPIVELSHDAERRHLELEYLPEFRILEDHQALQYEAEDIWAEFLERQADALNVTVVHLSPKDGSPPVNMISFRISRADNSEWRKEGGFAFPLNRGR
jgi:hypothetical protein